MEMEESRRGMPGHPGCAGTHEEAMQNRERRTKEMAVRVVLFGDRRPDDDPGQTVLSGKLKGVVSEMERAEAVQRSARIDRHTSALDKRRLRREMLAGPIAHVVGVANLARSEEPSLASQVRYRPSGDTYGGHLVAARGLLEEAQAQKELLAKHGLSDSVLEVYGQLLSQFEAAIRLGDEGRATHKGATAQLKALAQEAGRIVRALDARNQIRFKHDPKLFGEWISASTVLGNPGPGSSGGSEPAGPPAGGDLRPAA
jgi:hypothetical protein